MMADLYSEIGQNARKVLTTSDQTGPETTWLVVTQGEADEFETGTDYDAELTTANSSNYKVIQSIGMRCEIYEVVRPGTGTLAIKVRANSVPYAEGEARNDEQQNSILTTEMQANVGDYTVWNGAFQDDDINFND
jgi:hypothetical protein